MAATARRDGHILPILNEVTATELPEWIEVSVISALYRRGFVELDGDHPCISAAGRYAVKRFGPYVPSAGIAPGRA